MKLWSWFRTRRVAGQIFVVLLILALFVILVPSPFD